MPEHEAEQGGLPGGRVPADLVLGSLEPLQANLVPIEHKRERAAQFLAYSLMVVFGLVILSPLAAWSICAASPPPEMIAYAKEAAAVIAGLLGATVGFYFSQKRLG